MLSRRIGYRAQRPRWSMIAARYHRMTAIGAGYGYGSRAELINAGAHVICETPREIVSAIEALRTSHD